MNREECVIFEDQTSFWEKGWPAPSAPSATAFPSPPSSPRGPLPPPSPGGPSPPKTPPTDLPDLSGAFDPGPSSDSSTSTSSTLALAPSSPGQQQREPSSRSTSGESKKASNETPGPMTVTPEQERLKVNMALGGIQLAFHDRDLLSVAGTLISRLASFLPNLQPTACGTFIPRTKTRLTETKQRELSKLLEEYARKQVVLCAVVSSSRQGGINKATSSTTAPAPPEFQEHPDVMRVRDLIIQIKQSMVKALDAFPSDPHTQADVAFSPFWPALLCAERVASETSRIVTTTSLFTNRTNKVVDDFS